MPTFTCTPYGAEFSDSHPPTRSQREERGRGGGRCRSENGQGTKVDRCSSMRRNKTTARRIAMTYMLIVKTIGGPAAHGAHMQIEQ